MFRAINSGWVRLSLLLCFIGGSTTLANAQRSAYTDSLTAAITRARTDTGRAALLIALSGAYRSGAVAKAFYYANEASALADKSGWDKGKMHAEQLIGNCYIKVLAYNDAIVHFKRSIRASRKSGRQDMERACLQLMVHCYHMLDSLEQAAGYQKLLLDLTAQSGDALGECNQMSAYALRLSDMGRYREAIGYLQKDIALAEARFSGIQKTALVADLLNTLGTTYAKTNSTDSALICLRRATVYAGQMDNRGLSAYILSSFCDVYTASKAYDSAIYYGVQTMMQGRLINDIRLQQQYADVLSRLYKDDRQPLPALLYHMSFDSLTAILNNTQHTIDEAMQVTKINMEAQAGRNRLERRALEAARRNREAALAAALVAILALVVLTLFIYRSLRQKQKTNRIIGEQRAGLQQQNEIIDQALKEKEMLLKETHHRIKNNLQLVSSLLELQVAGMDNEYVKNALRTAQRRIQSIATVHSKLYGSGDDDAIEFSAFTDDLFTRLSSAFGGRDAVVRFENTIPATILPLNTVVLLGLILNELITNSFKHAFTHVNEPAIAIGLELVSGNYTLQYYDNGPGLPGGRFEGQTGSLGLYLVKRMSKQLKGRTSFSFDAGSRFIISFPHAGD